MRTPSVYAITTIAAVSLLSDVQGMIDDNVAFPLTGTAANPDQVGISFETTITCIAGSSQTDKGTTVGQATAAAQEYINNLGTGNPLIINDSAAGQPNRQIENIYIWRSRADTSRYSRSLVANYSPALGERVVMELVNLFCNLQ